MSGFEQFDLDFGFTPSLAANRDAPATVTSFALSEGPGKRIVRRVRKPRVETSEAPSGETDLFGSEVRLAASNDTPATTGSPIAETVSVVDDVEDEISAPHESEKIIAPIAEQTLPPATRPANFEKALALIEASAAFDQKQISKLRSHVNVVAKALQKAERKPDLTLLPCEPRLLRQALEGFHPARVRIKIAQWRSIMSGLRRILRLTNWLQPVPRSIQLSSAWASLLADIDNEGQLAAMRKFANFATSIGIEPREVSLGTFDRYSAWLEERILTLKHQGGATAVSHTWRRLCRLHPSWAIRPLPTRERYNLVATRKSDLPASFHDSARAYLARCAAPDPFDYAIGRAIAHETLRKRETYIYVGAQYLLDLGWAAERLDHVRAICTPEAVAAILREQFRRHSTDGKTWPPGAKPLASHLQTMAAQIGELTDADLAQVRKLAGRVPKAKGGFPRKTRERLAAFDDERVLRDFYRLPQVLWREAAEFVKADKPRQARAKAKYAIALAILLIKPLRISELASLDFRGDFRRDRKGRIVGLFIPGERTKTGVPIEAAIDATFGRRIAEYFERFVHPVAVGVTSLFPRQETGHVSGAELSQGIAREVQRHLGIKFNSHLARALVATIILDADPDAVAIAQRMLEHTHVDTTIRHYGMQRGRAAQRQYEQFLARTLRGRNS